MKKILLLVLICTASVFGYYDSDDFIDFLVHSNQFRARIDKLGFKLEANNVHVTAGFSSIGAGNIINNLIGYNDSSKTFNFTPVPLVGIGYKLPVFGIGLGYQYNYGEKWQVHTPVITMTALGDNLRLNVPVSIGVGSKEYERNIGISTAIEGRYYFNLPFMSHLRFYVKYGENKNLDYGNKASSFGLAARLYFRVELDKVLIEPIIRINYDWAVEANNKNFEITAFAPTSDINKGSDNIFKNEFNTDLGLLAAMQYRIEQPYRVGISLPVGFTAGNDLFSVYIEPALSFTVISGRRIYKANFNDVEENVPVNVSSFYSFAYLLYGEFYLKPLPNLEWYTEVQTGGVNLGQLNRAAYQNPVTRMVFNLSTGLTWYFNLGNNN